MIEGAAALSRRRSLAGVTAWLWPLIALAAALAFPSAATGERTEMFYSVSPDPDDEVDGWQMIQRRPQTYIVFVVMTRGEQTRSCMSLEESEPGGDPELNNGAGLEGFGVAGASADGPFRYQGPESPVGEPDKGERHPLGNPWVGQGSRACKRARVASWHWFLDDAAKLDPTLPDFGVRNNPARDDSYRGRFCAKRVGCAKVWATRSGARVAFDFGDAGYPDIVNPDPLTAVDVRRAIRVLHRNRKRWGVRVLPSSGVLANGYFYDGDLSCPGGVYEHNDHAAVQHALFRRDLKLGPQYGVSCPFDQRFIENPGPAVFWDPGLLFRMNEIDPATERRVGPYVRNYGWLFDTYAFNGDPTLRFWQRFGRAEPKHAGA